MGISIDRQKCMGTGLCVVYAGSTFAHDADTKAVVADPTGDSPEDIQNAIEACPTGAITLVAD